MSDPIIFTQEDRDLIQEIKSEQVKMSQKQDEMIEFQNAQKEINAGREVTLAKINNELSFNNSMLKNLSRLWLTEDQIHNSNGDKIKSRAIGTWSGWKILAGLFTILGGLVLAYQILVPTLIALNNAILNVTVFR